MKRVIVAALTAGLLAGVAGGPLTTVEASQQRDYRTGRERGWRQEECRFANRDGQAGWNVEEIKSTIRCVERRWDGNLYLGMAIVGCESGFDYRAQNPYSSAGGVWQALDSTWASWKSRFADLMGWWNLRPGKYNGRTHAILGWRVFLGTTQPWEASRSCWG